MKCGCQSYIIIPWYDDREWESITSWHVSIYLLRGDTERIKMKGRREGKKIDITTEHYAQ